MKLKIKNKNGRHSGSPFSIHHSLFSILAFLSILYSPFSIPSTALADEPILPTADQISETALTITPSIYEGVVTPGKTTSQIFEIKNSSYFPLPIKCYINLFNASDENGGVNISDEDEARLSPLNWVQIVEPDFVLQSQSTRKVTVNFDPPSDLTPGGYYAILFAEPLLPQSFLDSSSLQISGRLGSLLFMISPGDLVEKGSVVSAELPHYLFYKDKSELKIRFQNDGNVHLRPSGKVTITNLWTKNVTEMKLNEFTVLPNKIRAQQLDYSQALKWPGVYKVDAEIVYGRDNMKTNVSKNFIYLPIYPMIEISLIIIIFLLLIIGKTRRRIFSALHVIIKG